MRGGRGREGGAGGGHHKGEEEGEGSGEARVSGGRYKGIKPYRKTSLGVACSSFRRYECRSNIKSAFVPEPESFVSIDGEY